MSRKGIIVLAVIVVVATAIAAFKAFTAPGAPAGMPEHITIAQARTSAVNEVVKVGGDVAPGSISWDNMSNSLRFTLTGEGEQMSVQYQGLAPNEFKPGLPLVVEGTIGPTGTLKATALTPRTSPLCKACHG